MMLLTTLNAVRTRKALWEVVQGYLTRWRVEDTIRFIKQSYRLEHMRLLDYRRLKNMAALVVAVAYFAAAWLGKKVKLDALAKHVAKVSRKMFEVPEFFYLDFILIIRKYYFAALPLIELTERNMRDLFQRFDQRILMPFAEFNLFNLCDLLIFGCDLICAVFQKALCFPVERTDREISFPFQKCSLESDRQFLAVHFHDELRSQYFLPDGCHFFIIRRQKTQL